MNALTMFEQGFKQMGETTHFLPLCVHRPIRNQLMVPHKTAVICVMGPFLLLQLMHVLFLSAGAFRQCLWLSWAVAGCRLRMMGDITNHPYPAVFSCLSLVLLGQCLCFIIVCLLYRFKPPVSCCRWLCRRLLPVKRAASSRLDAIN